MLMHMLADDDEWLFNKRRLTIRSQQKREEKASMI